MISFDVAGLKKEKEKKWDVGVTGSHFRESLLQGLTVKVSQPEAGGIHKAKYKPTKMHNISSDIRSSKV